MGQGKEEDSEDEDGGDKEDGAAKSETTEDCKKSMSEPVAFAMYKRSKYVDEKRQSVFDPTMFNK